jgi:hypothetical protein
MIAGFLYFCDFQPFDLVLFFFFFFLEIMLYSEGFETATVMAKKMAQLYKLSSEQVMFCFSELCFWPDTVEHF